MMTRMMTRMAAGQPDSRLAYPHGKRGFTFAEVLVALLIMVLLTTFVASAIPVAFTTYRQVVSDSNAQVALSTTASALRDELGLAVDVKTSGGDVLYQTADGTWVKIENGSKGLVKREYSAAGPGIVGNEIGTTDLIPSAMIVGATGGGNLSVEMGGITYEGGVFTVSNIQVLMDGSPIESISEYKVKAVFGPES